MPPEQLAAPSVQRQAVATRGWRERWTSDGRPFYEQRSTGRICWEITHCVSDRESGGEDGGGYETDIRGPGVLGRRSKTPPIAEEP